MSTSISVEAKKDYIRWILKNHRMKRRESVWILNYILCRDEMLGNAIFTDEAHYTPRAIVVSTTSSESIPFRFYNGDLMTDDAEKSFHDIRLNPNDKLYIQVNYNNSNTCPIYATVREENEFIPEHQRANRNDGKVADEFLEYMAKDMTRAMLLARIDEALDNGDKKLFIELTDELNGIVMQKEEVLV